MTATTVEKLVKAGGGEPISPPLPPLEIGGPTSTGWREDALARVAELTTVMALIRERSPLAADARDTLVRGIESHLRAAKETAEEKGRLSGGLSGAGVVRTTRNIHAAESDTLRLAPEDYVRGQLPTVRAYVNRLLPRRHPNRLRLDEIAAAAAKGAPLELADTEQVIAALRQANDEDRKTVARLRSFRNVLLWTAALLSCGALGVMLLGALKPDALIVCFQPDVVVCPTQTMPVTGKDVDVVMKSASTGWDISLICVVGMLAAGIAAATSLRRIKGTSTPFSLPVALAVLKIPTGALTALLGLLLMRGEFVPGLSNLDTPGQILGWAVVFGASQQLFTRLVDTQAQSVLNDVGGTGTTAGTPNGEPANGDQP